MTHLLSLSIFVLLQHALALDFLVWTSDDQLTELDQNPWDYVKKYIKEASAESPVFLFAIQNTTVEEAAKQLNETSKPAFRQLKSDDKLKVPSDANDAQYFLFNSFEDYTARAPTMTDKFVVILSEPSAFDVELSRRKRVILNDENDEGGRQRGRSKSKSSVSRQPPSKSSFRRPSGRGQQFKMPVVLPPFNRGVLKPNKESGSCLFYLESLIIYVFNKKSEEPYGCGATLGSHGNNTFAFSSNSVDCIQELEAGKEQEFSFDIEMEVDKTGANCRRKTLFTVEGSIPVKLTFKTAPGFSWNLVGVETDGFSVNTVRSNDWLSEELTVTSGSQASDWSVEKMDIGATLDFSYACSKTKTAVFKTNNKNYYVGIGFENIQIQPIGYRTDQENKNVKFGRNVYDCVGTFSTGSLTGLIVTIILATVFIFGVLMLNSVQSIDRFDDPKQKQLVINARE